MPWLYLLPDGSVQLIVAAVMHCTSRVMSLNRAMNLGWCYLDSREEDSVGHAVAQTNQPQLWLQPWYFLDLCVLYEHINYRFCVHVFQCLTMTAATLIAGSKCLSSSWPKDSQNWITIKALAPGLQRLMQGTLNETTIKLFFLETKKQTERGGQKSRLRIWEAWTCQEASLGWDVDYNNVGMNTGGKGIEPCKVTTNLQHLISWNMKLILLLDIIWILCLFVLPSLKIMALALISFCQF